jgi:hypothetical protein
MGIALSSDEVMEAGEEIYDADLRERLEPDKVGQFAAIDVVSRDYRVGEDHIATVDSLRSTRPDAIIYTKRIGFEAFAVMGGRMRREKYQSP